MAIDLHDIRYNHQEMMKSLELNDTKSALQFANRIIFIYNESDCVHLYYVENEIDKAFDVRRQITGEE
jgi:hypothetical protein